MFFEKIKEWKIVLLIILSFTAILFTLLIKYNHAFRWEQFLSKIQKMIIFEDTKRTNLGNFRTIYENLQPFKDYNLWEYIIKTQNIYVLNCKNDCVSNGKVSNKLSISQQITNKINKNNTTLNFFLIPWKRTVEKESLYELSTSKVTKINKNWTYENIKYSNWKIKPFNYISSWLKWLFSDWYIALGLFKSFEESKKFQEQYFPTNWTSILVWNNKWIVAIELWEWFDKNIRDLLSDYPDNIEDKQPQNTQTNSQVQVIFKNCEWVPSHERWNYGNTWWTPNRAYAKYTLNKWDKLKKENLPPVDADGYFMIWHTDQSCNTLYKEDEKTFTNLETVIYGKRSCFKVEKEITHWKVWLTIKDYINNPSCSKNITIPNTLWWDEVLKVGLWAFKNKNIRSLTLWNNIVEVDDDAFADNVLSSLTLNKNLKRIGKWSFQNNQIKTLDIPQDSELNSIDNKAFQFNKLLSLRVNPKLEFIWNSSFENNSLVQIFFPHDSKLRYIWDSAFRGYNSLDLENSNKSSNKIFNLTVENYLWNWDDLANALPYYIEYIGNRAFENNFIGLKHRNIDDLYENPDEYKETLQKIKTHANAVWVNKSQIYFDADDLGYGYFESDNLKYFTWNWTLKIWIGKSKRFMNTIWEWAFANNFLTWIEFHERKLWDWDYNCWLELFYEWSKLSSKSIYENLPWAYNKIWNEAFKNNFLRDEIILPSNIKELGRDSFSNNNIEHVYFISKSLSKRGQVETNLEKIWDWAFQNNIIKTIGVLSYEDFQKRIPSKAPWKIMKDMTYMKMLEAYYKDSDDFLDDAYWWSICHTWTRINWTQWHDYKNDIGDLVSREKIKSDTPLFWKDILKDNPIKCLSFPNQNLYKNIFNLTQNNLKFFPLFNWNGINWQFWNNNFSISKNWYEELANWWYWTKFSNHWVPRCR